MKTPSSTSGTISPVLAEIIEWSQSQPDWRRDALRRLVQQGSVTETDLEEITLGCLAEHDALADGETAPKLKPLAASHVPTTSVANLDVRIRTVSDVKFANALAEGQQLEFGPDSISLVYGENGSGKSGYARILKHAGRARRKEDSIRSNVFDSPPGQPASATLQCEIGSTVTEVQWQDGQRPDELSSVSSFDSDCAVVHVNESNAIEFTPFGLDLFGKLVSVCKQVKEKIRGRVEQLEKTKSPLLANPECHENTRVGKLLRSLTASTEGRALTEAAHVEDGDEARAKEIEDILKSDPEAEAGRLQEKGDRLSNLLDRLKQVQAALGQPTIEGLFQLGRDAAAKRTASEIHAKQLAGLTPLEGVGSNPWIELWQTARRFSEHAYAGQNFPVTEDGAVCVLCQQTLDDDAKQRLSNFDQFVKDETEAAAKNAEKALADARSRLQRLRLDENDWDVLAADLGDESDPNREALKCELTQARAVRNSLTGLTDFDSEPPQPWTSTAAAQIENFKTSLSERATELLKCVNKDQRATLEHELHEIQDRHWLNENLVAVVDELDRLNDVKKLTTAEKATNHGPVSTKGGKLTTKYVTDELTTRFTDEVQRLCGRDFKVTLGKGKSQQGVATYQLTLQSKQDARPHHILSEGEFRCIAIAGFLTELATSENNSAIIFDDPVCSLGHEWRSQIAKRLVAEADQRQVIIFSHDMFFIEEIKRMARDEQTPVHRCHVARSATKIGLCKPDLPWFGSRTTTRIKMLRKRLKDLEANYAKETWEGKLATSENFFGDVRETIERAAEREFMAGCVRRFENYIPIKNLWEASAFSDSDADALHKLFRRCSSRMKGHDDSTSGRPSPPTHSEMLDILDDLKTLIGSVQKKREKLRDQRKSNRGPRQSSQFDPSF